MRRPGSIVIRGGAAGILAATALALWFLLVDALERRPLYTPAFLASVLLGREQVVVSVGLVALYTLLHYVVFTALGIFMAALLPRVIAAPSLLLGAVLGFLLFDIAFYLGVVVTGVDVVDILGWPEVLAGNVIAGVVLMAALRLTHAAPGASWPETLARHRIIREGVIAGLLGAGAVALWFFVIDAASGRLLFTPAALGSALFYGASEIAAVRIDAITVLGYTLLHVTAFLVAGMVAAAFATEAEEHPPLLLAFVLLFVTFETLFIGLLAIIAAWLLDALQWWTIAVGNIIAAIAMGIYLWREHPALRRVMSDREHPLEEPV
ncbi:MAG TPA: hypothetical protein VF192_12345 [Longimicrobiales bacterium]